MRVVSSSPVCANPDNVGFAVKLPDRDSFSPDAAFYIGKATGMKFLDGAPVFAAEVRSENSAVVLRQGRGLKGREERREQQGQQERASPADEIRRVNPGLFKEGPSHQAGTPPAQAHTDHAEESLAG